MQLQQSANRAVRCPSAALSGDRAGLYVLIAVPRPHKRQPLRVCNVTIHIRQSAGPRWRGPLICAAAETYMELDADLQEAMNEASTRAVSIMLQRDDAAARDLAMELEEAVSSLLEVGDVHSARFLVVLQGLLDHTLSKEATRLDSFHAKALDRLLNTIQGCGWRVTEEGKTEAPPGGGDKFSTWDDVMGKKGQAAGSRSGGGGVNGNSGSNIEGGGGYAQQHKAQRVGAPGFPLETDYYDLLKVPPNVPPADVRAAYRRAALRLHPDVNDAPDAEQRFVELSRAYDVLSNETSRRLYDRHGATGMAAQPGAGAGMGNARDAWDEFKPFKRENKRTRARDASRVANAASQESSSDHEEGSGVAQSPGAAAEPVSGDVVEYPLSDVVRADLQDGRTHGLALLVGRNKDRGDVKKLPDDVLDLCEVEPLRQEETGSNRWVGDELSPSAYCRLGDLRTVPVQQYDGRFDVWVISAELSTGCAGPELPEEIML